MQEKPILFSGTMVRAILEGRKSQTRRVIKPQPDHFHKFGDGVLRPQIGHEEIACPNGTVGDRLWVRETVALNVPGCPNDISYRADHIDPKGDGPANPMIWRPSIHMPRWASRIALEITGVRVERLQDITEEDAKAEGIDMELRDMSIETRDYSRKDEWFQAWGNDASLGYANYVPQDELARTSFRTLWDSINGDRPSCNWVSNPWLWAIEFKRIS